MEGLHRRRGPTLSLQREFTGSRLEAQILKRAFELVMAALRQEALAGDPINTASERASAHATGAQGG